MEIILNWIWPVMTIGSIYIFWSEFKNHESWYSLLKWLSASVWGIGNCLAIYASWPLGEMVGGVGRTLFVLIFIAQPLWRRFLQRE